MFVYSSRFLRRGEVWFENKPNGARVDWILYRNRAQPVPQARWRYFYNRLIDLTKTPDELMAEMEPKTVAKITAAEKDQVVCDRCDLNGAGVLAEVEQIWNGSIESKRRWGKLDRQWLGEMISADRFELVAAREASGTPIVYAGMYRDSNRVQQLMSVSPPRSNLAPDTRAKTNRASCLLLWNTLLRLKREGVRYFDFGGWYPGTEDIQLLGANAYKKGFGGQVVREFECEQIVTLKGWIVLSGAKLLARARELRVRNVVNKEANAAVAQA